MDMYLITGTLAVGTALIFEYGREKQKNNEIEKIRKGHGYTMTSKNKHIEYLQGEIKAISKKYEDLTSEHYEIEEMNMRQSEENIYLRSENKRLKEEAQRMREDLFWKGRK